MDAFLDAAETDRHASSEPAEVDEGSITAWATFGATMAEATATLEDPDRRELVSVLDRLVHEAQELASTLRATM
jgi:hypothetical protein